MDNNEKFTAYEFFRRERDGEDQFLGTLPERRNGQNRITHSSIMNWAKILFLKDIIEERVYFIRVEI